jgi:hypothetical protein
MMGDLAKKLWELIRLVTTLTDRIANLSQSVQDQQQAQRDYHSKMDGQISEMQRQISDLRERCAKQEAFHNAIEAEHRANLVTLNNEFERRFRQLQPGPVPLPPQQLPPPSA